MNRFVGKLVLEADDDGLPWTLAASLGYNSTLLGHTVDVPAGFQTDLASVPAAFQWLFPPTGSYAKAAVVHDYLYAVGCTDRGTADAVLKEAMEVCGTGWWTRQSIYWAVRSGGWLPWKRYREKESEQL